MTPSEYLQYDATALADLIRRGDASAREVTEAAIERAGKVNPALNAICHPQFSEALSQNVDPGAPFAGVPLLLKGRVEGDVGRKSRVICEVWAGDVLTATADSVFVRVDTDQLARAAGSIAMAAPTGWLFGGVRRAGAPAWESSR